MLGSIAFVVAWGVVGCVSPPPSDDSLDATQKDPIEFACEIAMIELERMIEQRSTEADFPAAALIEAQELHRMGKQLYLEREYVLALELIEEAIDLLEEKDDQKAP